MTVDDNARTERKAFARNHCEATGLHHPACPTVAVPFNESTFVLHHIIRRQDTHAVDYEHRDDVEHLRYVWNGTTSLGAGGCHAEIHRNQRTARRNGLLAPKPKRSAEPFPTFGPIDIVETTIGPVPRSTLNKQPAHIQERLVNE